MGMTAPQRVVSVLPLGPLHFSMGRRGTQLRGADTLNPGDGAEFRAPLSSHGRGGGCSLRSQTACPLGSSFYMISGLC